MGSGVHEHLSFPFKIKCKLRSMLFMLFFAFVLPSCFLAERVHYHGNYQEIAFPDSVSKPLESTALNSQLMISLELAKKINLIESDEEFFKLIKVIPSQLSYSVALADPFSGTERSSAIKPKPAMCIPELQVMPVKENPDPGAIYFPNCIRIKRCSGCCNHELLSCQPTATEIRNYQIHVTKIAKDLGQYIFKEIVALEEHTECFCGCKIKENDCTDKQYYNKDECRCICKRLDEEDKCRQHIDKKYWNPDQCSCQCRNVEECSTGFYFDQNLCSCKNLPISRYWFDDEKKIGYHFKQPGNPKESQPIIVTLDTNDPRRKHKDEPQLK